MKVFISHSTIDSWVARRISEDLVSLGVETFLDAKDLETGASIDATIHDHLEESDELLMLLSPAALKSHWVLLEIGGAMALKKRLIPILLHVTPNELPHPLSTGLARDINEIEKYYEEVKKRLSGKTPAKRRASSAVPTLRRSPPHRFEVGDTVILPAEIPQDRTGVGWNEAMEDYLGVTTKITEVDRGGRFARVDADEGNWAWAFRWLEPIGSQPDAPK